MKSDESQQSQQQQGNSTELTEEQLAAAGLVKKIAYIKGETVSGNAKRVKKTREKQAAAGVGQMNVVAPEAARNTIKLIADRTRSGEDLGQVLASLVPVATETAIKGPETASEAIKPAPAAVALTSEQKRLLELGERVERTHGLRGVLLAMLLAR